MAPTVSLFLSDGAWPQLRRCVVIRAESDGAWPQLFVYLSDGPGPRFLLLSERHGTDLLTKRA